MANENNAIHQRKRADWKNFVAGGVGGSMGAIITCPLEVVKTRLQALNKHMNVAKSSYMPHTFRALQAIVSQEGAKGLFKGIGPNLVGVAPSRAIYFGVYSHTKGFLVHYSTLSDGIATNLLAAITAGLMVAAVTSPIWLVKTRMQLQSNVPDAGQAHYKNSLDCVKRVYTEEGVGGFYKGLGASLIGISESAIQFVLYEKLKLWVLTQRGPQNGKYQVSNIDTLLMGAVAKLIACGITYPHEVLRTRLREQRTPAPGQTHRYTGVIQAFKLIAKEEGRAGLYSGMGAHLLRAVPNAAIMFWTYEFVIKLLG